MPACAAINKAMQSLPGVSFETSEQHKEASKACIDRDKKDTADVLATLAARNPFNPDNNLRNIMNGVTADENVNVDRAKEVGERISLSMEGRPVEGIHLEEKIRLFVWEPELQLK